MRCRWERGQPSVWLVLRLDLDRARWGWLEDESGVGRERDAKVLERSATVRRGQALAFTCRVPSEPCDVRRGWRDPNRAWRTDGMMLVRTALGVREQVCDPLSASGGTYVVASVGPVRMVIAMVVGVKAGSHDDGGDECDKRTDDERFAGTELAQDRERSSLAGPSRSVGRVESAHRCRPSRTALRWVRDAP